MNEIERHLICSWIRKIKEFLDIRMSTVPEVQFNTILIKVSKIIFTEIEKNLKVPMHSYKTQILKNLFVVVVVLIFEARFYVAKAGLELIMQVKVTLALSSSCQV